MITIQELDGAIYECENAPVSYRNCEKLATFYTVRDHMTREPHETVEHSYDPPQGIEQYGDSDLLQAITGRETAEIMAIMDELMDAILITNPRLYQGVMRRIKGQI